MKPTLRNAALLLGLGLSVSCALYPLRAEVPVDNRLPASAKNQLVHPSVDGVAGPFARVRIELTRQGKQAGAPFAGILSAGAVRLMLAGPDEPADFFMVDPTAIMFVPVDRSRINAVIVLYDSSRIGPGHGTEHRALVYRISRDRADRLRAIEVRLEGAASAAAVRTRLRNNK